MLNNCYDGNMRFLDWLANHLTYTMLKRWMIIGFALVLIGLFFDIPVKLVYLVAPVPRASLFAQPLHELGAIERWFYILGRMKYFVVLVDAFFRIKGEVFCRCQGWLRMASSASFNST